MEQQSSPVAANQRAKKVRIACQRCRDRRIKCDGQLPACSKCSKAGVPCIDVHSRSDDRYVPRSSTELTARLQWLESLVRERLPDIDLAAGPAAEVPEVEEQVRQEINPSHAGGTTLGKRSRGETSDHEESVKKKARRMALDLGLLSLDINASQVHYLGSSSGSFFASLLQGRDSAVPNEPPEASRRGSDFEQDRLPNASQDFFGTLKETLPSRKQCDALVEQYFSHYHHDYPVLHRPSFEHLVDGLYQCAAETDVRAVQHNGWPANVIAFRYNGEIARRQGKEVINISVKNATAQLFFVLGIAATLHTRRRSFSVDPAKFQKLASALALETLSDVSLPSLQLIILSILQSFLTQQGGNTWIMLHSAMAYAIDLGIHRDVKSSVRFSPTALLMRRRVFFCIYTLDRLISTAQGRPLGFQDDTLDLSLPSFTISDSDDKFIKQDQEFLPYSIARFRWATLISKIKFQFYRLRNLSNEPAVGNVQIEIHNELDDWLADTNLAIDGLARSDRARLHTQLEIGYHSAMCLLYQPSQACISPTPAAFQQCFDSAIQRIRLYGTLHEQHDLLMSWPTTHDIFLAGATLVYSIWMSSDVRSKATVSALTKDFRLCSNLLTLAGEWWPLAQRGRRSFERLADSTIDSLLAKTDQVATSSSMPADEVSTTEPDLFASLNFQSPSTNIESILQTFLQNDLALNDTLDMFDANGFIQDMGDWQQDGSFNFDSDYAGINDGQQF